jgi:hypothetical protein
MERRGPQVAEPQIAAFEAKLGAALPEDYRAFLLEVNGGRTLSSHVVFDIRNDQTILNTLHSLGDPDEQRDLETRWRNSRQRLPTNVLRVGADDGGGTLVVVISGPRRGQVWFLDGVDPQPDDDSPPVDWFDRRDVSKVAASFSKFIGSLKPLPSSET